jgi:hypothetical protein
MINKMNIHPS